MKIHNVGKSPSPQQIAWLRELASRSVLLTDVEPPQEVYEEFERVLAECRAAGLQLDGMDFFDGDIDCPLCRDMKLEHVYNQLTPGREHLSGVETVELDLDGLR